MWFAKTLVEQQLNERGKQLDEWGNCSTCGRRIQSKGFVRRRMLTLVGRVEWKRRVVGRCPWVQTFGQQAVQRIDTDLVHLANGAEPSLESVDPT